MGLLLLLGLWSPLASAQGPQFDPGSPPGAAGGSSAVGQPLGAANFPDFNSPSSAPFSGRPGPGGSHVPVSALSTPGPPVFRTSGAQSTITAAQPLSVPTYGELDLPAGELDYGSNEGMSIDVAIETLIQQNLELQAARLEIPMADADTLTANLRANPVFYADTQLVPYGHYSFLRPGGPPQSDININYPIDITGKRRARTASAREARSVTEAQLRDAVRTQIDNLYTVYVDVVAAGLTLKFSEIYQVGLNQLLVLNEQLYKRGQIQESDVLTVRAKVKTADLQVSEAKQAKIKANRRLAMMLNLPLDQVSNLDVRDPIGTLRQTPAELSDLINKAIQMRPDLAAIRIGVKRAQADYKLAKANGFPDVYILYQPYTFQNNNYLGVPSAYSWTLGLTATMPIYNYNQGNVKRAKFNITQTEIQVENQQRQVMTDVYDAVQELEQSRVAVLDFRKKDGILEIQRGVRNAAFKRFELGNTSALVYLDAQQDYNDVVEKYRDAMVRHRRAILDLNTAVGERVLP
jgi:cobalt-zinc-cadmium efflux system outer membrane protein